MTNQKNILNKYNKTSHYIFFIALLFLLFLYSIFDLTASQNTGFGRTNRFYVHLILALIIIFLVLYLSFKTLGGEFPRNKIFRSILIISIWIGIVSILRQSDYWSIFVSMGLPFLWALLFIYFNKFCPLSKRVNMIIRTFMLILFTQYALALMLSSLIFRDVKIDYVMNLSYSVLVFFPWLTIINNSKQRRHLIILLLFLIIFSAKRGAIIAFIFMAFAYFSYGKKNKVVLTKPKYLLSLLIFISLFILLLFLFDSYYFNGYLMNRFSLSELRYGSGRGELYRRAVEEILNRDFIDLFVGSGSGSASRILGTSVHQEVLEFLFSYGLIGLFLYMNFILQLILQIKYMKKSKAEYFKSSYMAFIYILIVGLYGQVMFSHAMLYIIIFIGFSSSRQQTCLIRTIL